MLNNTSNNKSIKYSIFNKSNYIASPRVVPNYIDHFHKNYLNVLNKKNENIVIKNNDEDEDLGIKLMSDKEFKKLMFKKSGLGRVIKLFFHNPLKVLFSKVTQLISLFGSISQ